MTAPFSWRLAKLFLPSVARRVAELEDALERSSEARELLQNERNRLLDEAARLGAVLDAIPQFVALSRLDGAIVYLNPAGRRLVGLGNADLSRVKQAALCPPWVYERTEREWLPRALKEGSVRGEGAFLTREGREVPVSFVMTVHRDQSGEPAYLSTVARDVAVERGAERALRERDELLRRATEASRTMTWQMDLHSGHVKCSANAEAVWGMTEGPIDAFVARVHPEDRDAVRVEMRSLRLGQPEVSLEFRVVHPSGAMRWLHASGVTVSDEEGAKPVRFVGVSTDITHRRVAEEALRDSERRAQKAIGERGALAARNARLEDALREAERARLALAGAVTHELREPLYTLVNAVQVLGIPGQESRLPSLRKLMQRQLERLVHSLEQLSARHGGAPAPGVGAPRVGKPGQRILVVDDNQDAAGSLAMLLKALGAEAEVAHDGTQALEMVPAYRPSAVLLDLGLPGMDGYEVARRLRERRAGAAPLLVALTDGKDEEEGRHAEDAGFDRHFAKPADLATLQSLLASLPAQAPAARL